MTINSEIRHRAVVHYKYFMPSLRKVCKLYAVSKSSLHRWVNASSSSEKASHIRKPRHHERAVHIRECVERHVERNPFVTMSDLAAMIRRECGMNCSRSTAHRHRVGCGYTRKKAYRAVEHVSPDLPRVREFCTSHINATNIVCIDEAGFYVGENPRYGYTMRGKRLHVTAGHTLRRSKFTLILAISPRGIVDYQILDHNCRKPDFVRFVENLPLAPGTDILMDNIRFHHSKETLHAIHCKGCRALFIPPYSPKFNAIENAFGVIKPAFRRQCATAPCLDGQGLKAAMHAVIRRYTDYDFTQFFERARAFSAQTLRDLDMGHAYIGYDS